MSKEYISIKDFDLFLEAIKPISKLTVAAKIMIDEFGVKICTKTDSCRCEVRSNSMVSENPLSIVVGDVGNFLKIMSSVASIHEGDYTNVKMFVDGSFLKVESKKFKTKFSMVDEEKISSFIDAGFKGDLSTMPSDYAFITSSNLIKRLNNHTFMFSDQTSLRIYLKGYSDMNSNTMYATVGDESNDFENSVTFEFGMVTSGCVGDNKIIMDFKGLNAINVLQADEITIKKPTGRNSLFSFVNKTGKNGTFLNMTMVSMILVK